MIAILRPATCGPKLPGGAASGVVFVPAERSVMWSINQGAMFEIVLPVGISRNRALPESAAPQRGTMKFSAAPTGPGSGAGRRGGIAGTWSRRSSLLLSRRRSRYGADAQAVASVLSSEATEEPLAPGAVGRTRSLN